MSKSVPANIRIRTDEIRENWANAVEAVEAETGKELSGGRGKAAADELTAEGVLDVLCVAYTGHDAAEVERDD